MASIASKNLFDLLGEDGVDPAQAQVATKGDKPSKGEQRSTTTRQSPAQERVARGGGRPRGDGAAGIEGAFRDRGTGVREYRGRGGRGRGRGDRGTRSGAALDDRHSKTGVVDHEKQVGRGWGQNTGKGEWADEQAGEAIAKAEESAEVDAPADNQNGSGEPEPAEEESKTKSYDDYLAEQAEKRLQVSGSTDVRKANEGLSKKFPVGKEFNRNEEDEDFIAGTGGKKGRERAKKEKNLLELDGEAMRQTDRNSDRRGGRGPRGRGSDRGRGRGDFRGGDRSRGRGGRGGNSARGAGTGNAPNIVSNADFPDLGS